MCLNQCKSCSCNTLQEGNANKEKYICSISQCENHFEVMDVNKINDDQEAKFVKYYKLKNNEETNTEMIKTCAHCDSSLNERCSMPTIGSRGKKRTTILTCSDLNCKAEYHVTDTLELKNRYCAGDIEAHDFRTIEEY